MLLVEALLAQAVGTAHEHGGPRAEVRQDVLGNRRVVAGQRPLRDALLRIDHAVLVTDPDARDPRVVALRRDRSLDRRPLTPHRGGLAMPRRPIPGPLADDLRRWLVLADPLERRVAKPPIRGPLTELDLGDHLRLDPARLRCAGRPFPEGGPRDPEAVEPLPEKPRRVPRESGADLAHVRETASVVVDAEKQGPEASARSLRLREAAHHEFLFLDALDLEPASSAAGLVGAVSAL